MQITAILPEGDRIWIGTQGRGIAEVGRSTGAVKWHDETNGLPDDWVRCIARANHTLYAGTFVGGLARLGKSRWITYSGLSGQEVTALVPDGKDGLIVSTRRGVYAVHGSALKPLWTRPQPPVSEAQALCLVDGELWIGTRNCLMRARAR